MTIYDIANEAGVAASTVSRVINNKPGIKAETRRKVESLIRKYNFTPDAAARGLVMQSTKTIGILIADIRVTHHTEGAFFVEKYMSELGYYCVTYTTGSIEQNMEKYLLLLKENRVEGVILMGSMFATEKVKQSIQKHLSEVPIVIVNGYLDLPNVIGVIADEFNGIRDCVDFLYKKGKRSIAFVNDEFNSPASDQKKNGYIKQIEKLGLEQRIFATSENSVQGGYDITHQILTQNPDTDAIVYAIDIIAVGGVRAVVDLGYRIPEQISLIGVDCSTFGSVCIPKLTSLDNKQKDLSELAAEMLKSSLDGKIKNKRLLMSCDIIERETT